MLPKIDVPIYTVKLLSNGEIVKFRPFTVKEEKLFLMANEADDVNSAIDTIKQVMNNCVLTEIDIDKLPIYDFEHLFLNIRSKSLGEIVKLQYKCNNDIPNEDGEGTHKCDNTVKIEVNVSDVNLIDNKPIESKIEITDKLGMIMKHPSFSTLKSLDAETEGDMIIKMTANCIDYIYDADQIYYAKDTTQEDLIEFVENLEAKVLEKIKIFFETMPKIGKDVDFKCSKCGYEEKMRLEGIDSFFV